MTFSIDQILIVAGFLITMFGTLWANRVSTYKAISELENLVVQRASTLEQDFTKKMADSHHTLLKYQAETFTNIQRVELKVVEQELRLGEKFATSASVQRTEKNLTDAMNGLRTDINALRDSLHPLAAELRHRREEG